MEPQGARALESIFAARNYNSRFSNGIEGHRTAGMKLREALETIQRPRPEGAVRLHFLLGCSSTPTNLKAFFHASLLRRRPEYDVHVETTLYGDLLGSLERLSYIGYAGAAVVSEWFDLDQRLGFRRLGGWAPSSFDDILATVASEVNRLQNVLEPLAAAMPVAIASPGLPLPPVGIAAPSEAGEFETRLCSTVASFARWCATHPGMHLLNPAELDRLSPISNRYDVKADLSHASPYMLAHAAVLGDQLGRILAPPPPMKGLITDLDDTLWDGILGEVGVEGIRFTLDTGAQVHGLYQQFLRSLVERGVLVGIASKNDPILAEQALARTDLLIRPNDIFPVCANWEPKSGSVSRILKTWNIGPEAVVFIDDSPSELAEVQARFPEIRSFLFPRKDPTRLLELFETLRECFGKRAIREEDRIRLQSLRSQSQVIDSAKDHASEESFLSGLEAILSFQLSSDAGDERAFELVNKTNQFNLNGRRIAKSEWAELLCGSDRFLLTVSYADKFGPLGKIAVVVGSREGRAARATSWVMSCRAFSRRIEHATLRYLFDRLDAEKVCFEFQPTERNGPVRTFFADFAINESAPELSRTTFEARCPQLSHSVKELVAHG